MKKSYALILIVLLVAGCAASRTQVLEPKKAGFENYSVLEITDLKNNLGSQVPAEVMRRVPDAIAEKVRALNLFQAVNRVPAVSEAAPETNALILEGTIIEYETGSRALRYFVGFGAGKAYATVQLKAVDKATKEEIFRGNIAAEQSMGVFGGSFDEVIQKLVDESVECIQMNYSAGERVSPLPREVKGMTSSEEQQVASLPKDVERPIVRELKLRDTPKEIGQNDLNRMIEEYNFYEKDLNGSGDFPNDLVDNGDGTITDRATGLMWEKGGSSSLLRFRKAKIYVSRLNEDTFAGYNDWRIPTLEELCSLLEKKVNERGQHISSLFKDKQSKCLSEDFVSSRYTKYCGIHGIVNFTKGKIDETATENIDVSYCHPVFFHIRAVRAIK
jgi:hypothetical protein